MSTAKPLAGIEVAVLAGGLGSRVAAILGETPKILAPVGDRCFLDCLLDQLAGLGAAKVVLCLGHLADKVLAHLRAVPPALPVEWVVEDHPLGTAGALALARPRLASDPVLVMNGDTWLVADYAGFTAAHRQTASPASVLCVGVDDVARYGAISLSDSGLVQRFAEKGDRGPGLINGGAVLLSTAVLARLPEQGGLERDVLETLVGHGLRGFADPGARFIDIGTPQTLARAETVIGGGP